LEGSPVARTRGQNPERNRYEK